jgi:hypothetical protein
MQTTTLFTQEDITPWGDEIIEGKLIVLKDTFFKSEWRNAKYQLVLAAGGFGCDPSKMGNAIYVTEVHTDNPETYRIERCNNDVLGIATKEAIAEWKEIYGEFNDKVLNYLNKTKQN